MSENSLKPYIDKFFDQLELYDDYYQGHHYESLLKAGIDVFLDNENEYNAYEVYQTFFMIYQITAEKKSAEVTGDSIVDEPNTLLELVMMMRKYEENTGDLIEKQRDHFIHSVNVFLLGLAIYAQNKNYREAFSAYVTNSTYEDYYKIDGKLSHEEFLYRWGVASLFHDIGYPVEIIGKQLNKFISDGVKSISPTYKADTAIDFKDFNEFNTIIKMEPDFADDYTKAYPRAKFLNLFKPTDIMAHKISLDFPELDINDVVKHLDNFVYAMGDMGFVDHGFFSSILVMNSYGYLMQKYARKYVYFFYPIVDSATAILLHNYHKNVLQRQFGLPAMDPHKSPIAYLLILCDELQEWNRRPLGVMDKQRSHVNDLEIEITDSKLTLDYIVKTGSMGLGFSEDKESEIRNLVSIPDIFGDEFRINTNVEHEDIVMREIIKSESQVPNVLLRNVEQLALQIHQQYLNTTEQQYREKKEKGELDDSTREKYENRKSFDQLSAQLKIANFRQARSIPKKLNMIGCELANMSDPREAITEFTDDEILDLAILEHDDWCDEKIQTGWVYGPERDDDNLIHDCIVPWDELTPEIQQYDIDPVKNIPALVDSIGLKIVRSRIRMLTIEMHKLYQSNVGGTVDFEDLPDYVKYSNYRQAEFLIKIITELGFRVLDADDEREAIEYFDENSLEYLAEREHNSWYKLKVDLGWKYGPERDDDKKINPNLVKWDELDPVKKDENKSTFRQLPELCEDVGLKIVLD